MQRIRRKMLVEDVSERINARECFCHGHPSMGLEERETVQVEGKGKVGDNLPRLERSRSCASLLH